MEDFFDLFKYDNNLIVAKYSSKNNFNYITLTLNYKKDGLSWVRGILKRRKYIYFRDIENIITSNETVNIIIKGKSYIFKFPTNYQTLIFYKGLRLLSEITLREELLS